MPGIFEGLNVIDCGSFIAAPAAATVLSDFGADVVKIEPPGAGDPYRHLTKLPGNPLSEHNYAWLLESRNKRSLALDLAQPQSREVLHRLVARADVFVTNYPPRVRQRLGLDYDTLQAVNGRLIYAGFTGYGERGEEADKPGFDVTAWWARSGMMDTVRSDAGAQPVRPTPGMGDHPAAISLYAAIVTALYQRERTGRGAQVSSSLLANGVWSNGYLVQAALCGAQFIPRPPREEALNALGTYYCCRDGRWLILTILNEERQWPLFAKALGREDLTDDPRFATKKDRLANSKALVQVLDETFASQDRAFWRDALHAQGIVFDVVATPQDVATDAQMRANDLFRPFEGSGMLTVDSPFRVAGSEKAAPRLPPVVGEHTDDILREAGFDDAAIAALRAGGVLG